MARSIDTQQSAVRGFVPAQNDEERFLMRHVEDLARAAFGRGMAAELVAAGRVEINHLPVFSAHAPVYESDVFTVRGKGRFRLTALPGKSKKDRQIIEFFQY